MSRNIGEEGKHKNNSRASSAVNRVANVKRIKKYDEFEIENMPKFSKWLLIFTSIGVVFAKKINLFVGMSIIIFPLIWYFYKKTKAYADVIEIYKNGLITPASITKIDDEGIELLYLAPMNKTDSKETIFGCKKMKIKELPGTNLKIGEKIPCVSIFYHSSENKKCWRNFDSRPLTWGFKNRKIIESALVVLSSDKDCSESCWSTLEKLSTIMDNKKMNVLIYFDERLNPVPNSSDKK